MIELLHEQFFLVGIILIIISFLYSSVGHGGASGYIAVFVLFSFPTLLIRPTALMMNILVSGISFFLFAKRDFFKWNLFLPFALTSIPAAFLGSLITLNPRIYKTILAVFLLIAIMKILGIKGETTEKTKKINSPFANLVGIVIGLFSGMIGIGGGIILSPVILLLKWGTVKQTAAVSALFIFVNSISGLIGNVIANGIIVTTGLSLLPFVLLGSICGAFTGSYKLPNYQLQYMLQFVLLLAFIKLITFP